MSELISIIMPVFAVEKHITFFEKALEGIINQTYINWELIIACDGGFKTTVDAVNAVVKKYNDKRIRLFKSTKQFGPGIVRNMAFRYANGNYLTFHDSDDWSEPERFEKLMSQIDANGIVASQVKVQFLYDSTGHSIKDKEYSGKALDILIQDRKVRAPICMASSIMTRGVFNMMGGFEKFKYSSDAIFVIKLAYLREMTGAGPIPLIDEFLLTYNRHSHSVTTTFGNAYTLRKCQKAQRKPLMKVFREKFLKGEVGIGSDKKLIKRALGIIDNLKDASGLVEVK
jgi:glycosyltransferase involved in cell wall biosynthesis